MKKLKKVFIFASVLLVFVTLLAPSSLVLASGQMYPTPISNVRRYLKRYSSLVSLSSGYMRVYYDSANKNIGIEYYDDNFNITKKNKLELELPIYGGFYAGKNAYYIVEGQNNKEENTNAEVIRVIKYDTNWKRVGAASITGDSAFAHEVRYPFDAGNVEMTETDGKLYVVTGHEGYVDDAVGQGHQGLLMIEVNESTFAWKIADADLWHSFAQYIDNKDNYLYLLEQSEGSETTLLTRYDKSTLKSNAISLLPYGGERTSAWAVACFASVDGVAVSQNNILGIGTSIDQNKYDEAMSSALPHNIYLTVTPINNFSKEASTVKWLTSSTEKNHAFTGLELTKINDNRFLVSWSEYKETKDMIDNDTLSTNVLHYMFIDGNGNKVGNEFTAQATITDCKPIIKGNKIIYYASNGNMVDFYTIDATTGKFSKVMHRVAGENATWSLSNGILKVTGSGAINIDPSVTVQFPLSSTLGGYSYSGSDNSWKAVRGIVDEIFIDEGITTVPDSAFVGFANLTQVTLPKTMKSIGKSSFASNSNLRKIFIPASVKSIGEDSFWTGSYWVGSGNKVVYVTIYTPKNSYAETWAKTNNVSYVNGDSLNPITGIKLNKTSLSMVKGKTEKLTATITPSNTLDSKVLAWTSSNTKVATVDANGNVKAIDAGTANITVKTSNGLTAVAKVVVSNPTTTTTKPSTTKKVVAITSVKINQGNISLGVNKTSKLTATINPSNTTQSKNLTWTSSNSKIATVDKNGNVKGIKAGTANITVKTSNGKTATIKVTVKKPTPIKSVKLNKKTLKLELGKSATVKATINPSSTTDSKVLSWSTSNKKVAIVDKNGKITAVGGGSATITVKTANGKKAKVKVTVSKINAKKATISAIKNQVQTGKALKPSVQVKLNGKVLKNGTDYTVSYKNNKKAGKATVTVKFKGNYTGSKTSSFIIIPSKVNIKNPSTSKKSITVKYSKVSGAKSYQTAYRLKGTNKWSYTTKSKISKLTSGKEYEIMIRAGIKSGKNTIYGTWSNVKTIKVK